MDNEFGKFDTGNKVLDYILYFLCSSFILSWLGMFIACIVNHFKKKKANNQEKTSENMMDDNEAYYVGEVGEDVPKDYDKNNIDNLYKKLDDERLKDNTFKVIKYFERIIKTRDILTLEEKTEFCNIIREKGLEAFYMKGDLTDDEIIKEFETNGEFAETNDGHTMVMINGKMFRFPSYKTMIENV